MARRCMAWAITGYHAQPRGRLRVLVEPVAVGNRSGDGIQVRADPDTFVQRRIRPGEKLLTQG